MLMNLLEGSLPPLNSLLLEREKEVELNKSQHYLNDIFTTVTQRIFPANYCRCNIINPGVTLIKTRWIGVENDRILVLCIQLNQQSHWNDRMGPQTKCCVHSLSETGQSFHFFLCSTTLGVSAHGTALLELSLLRAALFRTAAPHFRHTGKQVAP